MCHVMSGDPGADERVQPVPEGLGPLTQLRPLQVSQHSPHSPHSHITHTSHTRHRRGGVHGPKTASQLQQFFSSSISIATVNFSGCKLSGEMAV